jgi:hypothetical protein
MLSRSILALAKTRRATHRNCTEKDQQLGSPLHARHSTEQEVHGGFADPAALCAVSVESLPVGASRPRDHLKPPTATVLLIAMLLVASACSTGQQELRTTRRATSSTTQAPPPAASEIDNTVSVTIALADSFDVLAGGKCAGRSNNSGISDGARVQLRGDTVGGSTWATATARVERRPVILRGKEVPDADDGLYCVVEAVFAPSRPDPQSSYSLKFVGGDWWQHIVHVGTAPYGQLDRPGYGRTQITVQLCESPLDPPEKDC